jgi:hypothetical protein
MSEYPSVSESSISIHTDTLLDKFDNARDFNMKGGELDEKSKDVPNGGFLPIILCKKKEDVTKQTENREFKTRSSKTSISIKDILTKRKNRV